MSEDNRDRFEGSSILNPEMEMVELGKGVPGAAELAIEDINPHNPYLFSENRWHEHFARLRSEDPVHLNELESAGRYWSITRYDDIKQVDSDWETFSSEHGITLGPRLDSDESPERQHAFISTDPPVHTEQRKTVRAVSAPTNLRNLEPLIRERTINTLESLPDGEEFDWVEMVSVELTTLMLATLFDFPLDDRRKLTRWSDVVFAIPEPGGIVETEDQKIEELMECAGYFDRLWKERKENPGGDLVSMLANGEATGDQSALEHLGTLLLLITGGNDTTRNSMSGSVYGLDQFPDQFDKLANNPDLVPKMVPEIIRWQTPIAYMRRTATRDTEIGGKQIRKRDQVLMWYVSANQDEAHFDNAGAIDIERANADRHLAFGYGIHFCMGSRLAELQLRVLWEEILQRFTRIEVQSEPERPLSSFVHGYTKLPVVARRK